MRKIVSLTLPDGYVQSAGFNDINDFTEKIDSITGQKMRRLHMNKRYGDRPRFDVVLREGHICLDLVLCENNTEPENGYIYQDLSTDEFEHFAPYFKAFVLCLDSYDLRKVTYCDKTPWTNMIERFIY